MRLLLVEDEPTLRASLRMALQEAGYVVDEADNGRDAHFWGDTESFDAVVLDLGLPVMDGLTVLKRWRSNGQTSTFLGNLLVNDSLNRALWCWLPIL